MSVTELGSQWAVTQHGLLVPLGRFADRIGLIGAIEQVPFGMKTVDHSPADKVCELLAHILAGGMHIVELRNSPHPLVEDREVARAWGQQAFASASGVSDLLHSVSTKTVDAFKVAVRQATEPFRRRILDEVSPAFLVVDLDLTGLVVSDQSDTYDGADFGYMGEIGKVGRGYQFARAQLVGPSDAYVLGGSLHPGHTISQHCLEGLVVLTEKELGRPRRRVEAVESRLIEARQELAMLESRLAKKANKPPEDATRQRLAKWCDQKRELVRQLEARRDALAAENATNPNPRRIILRLDGGFGIGEKLAWLWEQGYSVVARAHSYCLAGRLRQEEGLKFEKVSKNGYIAEALQTEFTGCPYPMRLFACRQWWGDAKPEHWSALVVTPDLGPKDWPVRRVGVFYNGRQVIEAGIKEGKGVFASRHLPTRNGPGVELYETLVLLAQNLIRWFRRYFLANHPLGEKGIREMVRIGTNSPAQIVLTGGDATSISFTGDGPWRGFTFSLKRQIAYQMLLPFADDFLLAQQSP